MNQKDKENILKAGKIVSEIRKELHSFVKPKVKLLEIAEKIETRIIELGGKPAFPVNLSINEITAHYTPSYNDETLSHGLLKVDFGVHINGWSADNSVSFDLENSEENKKLIIASEKALEKALEKIKINITLSEIGKTIQENIENFNLNPIVNLCGHSISKYGLHSGLSIPNINNNSNETLTEGLYAIEPFVTKGNGKVKDGKPSGIYQVSNLRNPRSDTAREILDFISEEYNTLPFCSRWLVKKFGTRALLGLSQLEKENILHQFPQLIEISKSPVAQAEHTILITEKEVIVTTK